MRLDRNLGELVFDNLIVDSSVQMHATSARLKAGQGMLLRGSALALIKGGAYDGQVVILGTVADAGETLTPRYVLTDDIDTGEDTGEAVLCTVYSTGHFAANNLKVKEGYEITAADRVALSNVGLQLSNIAF